MSDKGENGKKNQSPCIYKIHNLLEINALCAQNTVRFFANHSKKYRDRISCNIALYMEIYQNEVVG